MKAFALACCIAATWLLSTSFQTDKWENLLDKKLSGWNSYLSFKHTDGDKGQIPKDAAGNLVKPVGYNKDTSGVFTIVMEGGQPVLRISGAIYGCLFTKTDYADYRLQLKVRWGHQKYVPRLHDYKDSGILYNSQGEAGVDYWHSWMLAQEFQVGEGTMGDHWAIASAHVDIRASKRPDTASYIFDPKAAPRDFSGYCQAAADYETKGDGAWTQLELISFKGESVQLVNGHVAMALSNSRYKDGDTFKPLTHGRIQLQSEAAEVFYKDIRIQHIDHMPAEYAGLFK